MTNARIVTKTGDKGYSRIWGGKRLKKDHPIFEALGSLDELSSLLGILITKADDKDVKEIFASIQKDIYKIMAFIAGKKDIKLELKSQINFFEQKIKDTSKNQEKLNRFILPQGNEFVAFLHFARAVARRAEIRVVAVCEEEEILKYMNRLSDFLFALAVDNTDQIYFV